MFPPSGTFKPKVFNKNSNFAPAASQAVNVMARPQVSASVSLSFCPSISHITSLKTQYQVPCDSDSGEIGYTEDDYLAAVTLATGFQREI